MIAAVFAVLISTGPQSSDTTLAQWEACAISSGSACPTPKGTETWKACLEATDPGNNDAWDLCELTSFPDCFEADEAEDSLMKLRTCSAQRVVAARSIASDWMREENARGSKEVGDQMAAYISQAEQYAGRDVPSDPYAASGRRVGTWVTLLKGLAILRRHSL